MPWGWRKKARGSDITPAQKALRAIRIHASRHAFDPLTLGDLRSKRDEVGALVYEGCRVESALYHRGSVVDADGVLLDVLGGRSPVTGRAVDGFVYLPELSSHAAFAYFLAWVSDDFVEVSEVATALAAQLPAEGDGIELFIRDHFDVDSDGLLCEFYFRSTVLPFCCSEEGLAQIAAAAPVPDLSALLARASKDPEMLAVWVDYWNCSDFGHDVGVVGMDDFRFAVALAIYRALGDDCGPDVKEAVTALVFAEAGVTAQFGTISLEAVVEEIAPALLANLRQSDPVSTESKTGDLPTSPLRKIRRASIDPSRRRSTTRISDDEQRARNQTNASANGERNAVSNQRSGSKVTANTLALAPRTRRMSRASADAGGSDGLLQTTVDQDNSCTIS